jgi:hypothetical protein
LAAEKSQREIAGELSIPRTSLQKMIKQLEGSPAPKTPAAAFWVPAGCPPVVDTVTLVVNRALRVYFERKKNGAVL